ncbi:hypothetical protein LWC35_33660 [Pseudonocardia kujensis]|nr:hypothetical protein [Pseudonocardia kujensis]MCE0767811.1 hypothetical protein [Pseudonocardia kujensis]
MESAAAKQVSALHRNAGRLELGLVPADDHGEAEAPVRDVVDGRGRLGEADRADLRDVGRGKYRDLLGDRRNDRGAGVRTARR